MGGRDIKEKEDERRRGDPSSWFLVLENFVLGEECGEREWRDK